METINWNIAKTKSHDASGITNPEKYEWYNHRGIYFPVIKCLNCGKYHFSKISYLCPDCEEEGYFIDPAGTIYYEAPEEFIDFV
jgi:uncharacterized OB-fold protein